MENNENNYNQPCSMVVNASNKLDAVYKVLYGNGREGLLERMVRIETKVGNIDDTVDSVKKETAEIKSELKVFHNKMIDGFEELKSSFLESEDKSKIDFRSIVKEMLTSKIVYIFSGMWGITKIIENWESISKIFQK